MGCKKFRKHIELMFYNDGSRRMGVKGIMSFRSRTGSRLIILIASSTNNKRICKAHITIYADRSLFLIQLVFIPSLYSQFRNGVTPH